MWFFFCCDIRYCLVVVVEFLALTNSELTCGILSSNVVVAHLEITGTEKVRICKKLPDMSSL